MSGYGKGLREELAGGFWLRFRQKMREPMTHTDLAIGFAILAAGFPLALLGALLLMF